MKKKLYRSKSDQKLAGVCAGLADFIGIDPTIVRVIWALVAIAGAGIIAYIACALIIPEEPDYVVEVEE